jgi:protein SCO1
MRRGSPVLGFVVCAALVAPASIARGQPAQNPAAAYFTDVVLTDQHGAPVRLYSDLIKDRTIIVAPFFTSCTSACPVMMRTLAKIQAWLGDRLGRDAVLVSITVDPARDTVDRLRSYATDAGARRGWYFLSGAPANVELALTKLGQRVDSPEGHSNLMIVGNDATGLWKKAFGLADSDAIIRVIDSVLNDRGEADTLPDNHDGNGR